MGSISQLRANRFIFIHTSVHSIGNLLLAGGKALVGVLRKSRLESREESITRRTLLYSVCSTMHKVKDTQHAAGRPPAPCTYSVYAWYMHMHK